MQEEPLPVRAEVGAEYEPVSGPLVSVVTPVRNVPVSLVQATIESVNQQTYPHWELCLVDDASTDPLLTDYLRALSASDTRIKVAFLDHRRGISGATNAAIGMAEGELIAFVDNDDLLHPDALSAVAEVLEQDSRVDVIYTDEDKLGFDDQYEEPYYKPDWAPDLLLSCMYFGHLLVIRRHLIISVGGLRSDFDGSQDYDLVLRAVEKARCIRHIPRVLYHWRRMPGSTAERYENKPYADAAAKRAIDEAITRRRLNATVEHGLDIGSFRVRYASPANARVSVIIPTYDQVDLLSKCVSSLERTVDLERAELLIVNNASIEQDSYTYFRELRSRKYVTIVDYSAPFNYSKINNFAVRHATGEYLLFLNNDTEALEPGWIEAMLEQAQRPEVGAVGCRLFFPGTERRIQHAGVILGMTGVAGHAHKWRKSADSTFYGPNRVTNYSAVTGACLMMRRGVFDLVGGFDEEFAVAFNDIDLCLRLGQRGFRTVYTPFATLIHHESMSVGRLQDGRTIDDRETELMMSRWRQFIQADPYYNPNLPLDVEDFASVVLGGPRDTQYSPVPVAPAPAAQANNPVWALPGIALHVLRHEGPAALKREAVRYMRERL